MLMVKTRLGISWVHGIGLFAAQFIPQGTVTWEYHPDFDPSFDEADIARMPFVFRNQFLNYAYYDSELQRYVLCLDDLRFINHCSQESNIISAPRRDVAARNIHEGEELLCDYRCYESDYFARRGISENEWM